MHATKNKKQTNQEAKRHLIHPRWLRITAKTVMWLLIVIVLIPVAIYIPPVQTFLKDTACSLVEKSTGMKISIGKFRLKFPAYIALDDVLVLTHPGDTMAMAREAIVDVKLLPLFKLDVDVERVKLLDGHYRMVAPDSSMILNIRAGELLVKSGSTVSINRSEILLSEAVLKRGKLDLYMDVWRQKPIPEDSTSASTPFLIRAGRLELEDFQFGMSMLPTIDTLAIHAGKGEILQADINLRTNNIRARRMTLDGGNATYLTPTPEYIASHPAPPPQPSASAPMTIAGDEVSLTNFEALYAVKGAKPKPGFDASYIQASGINISVNNFYNKQSTIRLPFASIKARERSGLNIVAGSGTLGVDSTGLTLQGFSVRTPFSNISADAYASFGMMSMNPDAPMDVTADVELGLPDIESFMPAAGHFLNALPSRKAITATVRASGSISALDIPQLRVNIPSMLKLNASGKVYNPTDFNRMRGQLAINGHVGEISPLMRMLGLTSFSVPPLTLKGTAAIDRRRYTANLQMLSHAGDIAAKGFLSLSAESYDADIRTRGLDISRFMPSLGIGTLTADIKAHGTGFSPQKGTSESHIDLDVVQLEYNGNDLRDITALIDIDRNVFDIDIDSRARNLNATVKGTGNIAEDDYTFDLTADIVDVNLKALGFSANPNGGSATLSLQGMASPGKGVYDAYLLADNIYWQLGQNVINLPEGISAHFNSGSDFVDLTADARLLNIDFHSGSNLDDLLKGFTAASGTISRQIEAKHLSVDSIRGDLPQFTLNVNASGRGMMGKLLEMYGISTDSLSMKIDNAGLLAGNVDLLGFNKGDIKLDTITLGIKQRGSLLDYRTHIGNRKGTLDEFASVDLNGYIGGNRASLYAVQKNIQGKTGYRLGLTAAFMDSTLSLHFTPLNATIAYLPWELNDDNYIEYNFKNRIEANLIAKSAESRILLETEENEKKQQELHINLTNIHIQDFINMVADAPPLTGTLNSDMRLKYHKGVFIGKGNLDIGDFTYARQRIGNIGTDFKAGLNTDGNTGLSVTMSLDSTKAMTLRGVLRTDSVNGRPPLQATLELNRFPLSIANPFIGKETATLSGYLKGKLNVAGSIASPVLNGDILCDSAAVYLPIMGSDLKLNADPITVAGNLVTLKNFNIFGANKNPLSLNGTVDARDFSSIGLNLNLSANDFMLINNDRKAHSDLYGKLLLDLNASATGRLSLLDINANLDILGGTDVTYAIPAAARQLQQTTAQDVVKFVQFSDTTAMMKKDSIASPAMNMRITANLNISNGVQTTVLLSGNGTDKVQLSPSGSLNYFQNYMGDMRLNGQLNLGSGFARYSVPVIGEKMFEFNQDCYVLWNGNLMNPTLHLSAVDDVKCVVKDGTGSSRLVNFLVTLNVSNTLSQPKIAFDLSTDDDISIQNELSSMSSDQRSAQAMNLLITGQYNTASTKTASGTPESALYSFLESQINSWAANNIRGVDLSFGIDQYDQTVNGRNTSTMSYSYQVSKSLFDNRFKIIVGGNYSTDASADENFAENLISDISFEYMLRQTNTMSMYLKLFRHTGFESVLEGEVSEMGVGFVMRRKIGNIKRLFRFLTPRHHKSEAKDITDSVDVDDSNTPKDNFRKINIPSDSTRISNPEEL